MLACVNMFARLAGAFAIGVLAASSAWAQGYFGASLGVSDTPARCEDDLVSKTKCDGNVVGARGFLGYSFTRELAIEAGLAAIGTSDGSSAVLDLSGLASMPLSERVALFGRLGVAGDSNRADLTYGAGLRFDLEKASLRLEWQHFGSDGGIDFIFLGVLSRF